MTLGYFDTLANNHIKTLDDGRKVFFAQGPMGRKGYLIPNAEAENALRQSVRRFYIGVIVCCGILGGIAGPLSAQLGFVSFLILIFVSGLFGWVLGRLYFGRFTKTMQTCDVKNSPTSNWAKMGKTLHPLVLCGLTLICLLFVIGGLLLFRQTHDPKILLCSLIFALMLIPYSIAIWHRLKK